MAHEVSKNGMQESLLQYKHSYHSLIIGLNEKVDLEILSHNLSLEYLGLFLPTMLSKLGVYYLYGVCFSDTWNGTCVLRKTSFTSTSTNIQKNTPKACMEYCKGNSDHKYIGLIYDLCICGKNPPASSTLKPITYCRSPCPGQNDLKCGDLLKKVINVYVIGQYRKYLIG